MRGNSGFLRWMSSVARSSAYFGRHTPLVVVTLALLAQSTHAGPISTRHRRMMREVYTDFETKNQTDVQPEGTCFLDGQQVPESTVYCDKKPGCRAIQKTGYCCPDYQCECERDGKTYSNGEKLVDPKTPCKVCYCQGGEITCSNVSCYERNDCEPKYITGRCCPEYDNCPPLENVKSAVSKESFSSETQSTSNSPLEQVSSPSPSTLKPEVSKSNPLGIKIKEITKPEEIRIIDEKPKPLYPIIKPMDSSNTNQMKVAASKESQPVNSIENSNQSEDELSPSLSPNSSEGKPSNGGVSAEAVNKLEMADVNAVNDEDSQKTVRHTGPMESNKSQSSESPEEVPMSGEDKKAAASQIGKEVVIVDRNGNSKPITVFGVEGLQRGDVVADAPFENSNSSEKEDDKKEIQDTQDLDLAASSSDDITVLALNPVSDKYSTERTTEGLPVASSVVFDTVLYTLGPEIPEDNLNLTGAVFDTVFHEETEGTELVNVTRDATKYSTERTTEGLPVASSVVFDTVLYTLGPEVPEDNLNLTGVIFDTVVHEETEGTGLVNVTREGKKPLNSHHQHVDDYDSTSNEPNPAYPTIEDDLSNYGRDDSIPSLAEDYVEGSHKGKSAEQADEPQDSDEIKISTEGLGSLSPTMSTSSFKSESTTEGLLIRSLSDEDQIPSESKVAAPGEPFLTPEWERNTTTEAPINETFEPGSGSGSGFGQIAMESTGTSLKGVAVIDEFEEFIGGSNAHSSMSSEHMGDDPTASADSITYNEGVGKTAESSALQDSLHRAAVEVMHTFKKGYLNVF